ncbi:hypothetical protein [Roseofilum casamattae]|nr:hypothetical protein [Roseofilum casamattae]
MKKSTKLPIWQITFPLCVVLIFGIGAFAAFHMVEGRYLFDVDISPDRIKIRTDVDKRDRPSLPDKIAENDDRHP